tara:strand:- start:15775 stop:16368 length:594 start_codon:yes stop_codon:yes gene_type:complete
MRYVQLTEDVATDIAVFYGGRFQPMHKGHHKVYMDLVEQFGSSNVFIATTIAKNATPEKDPFSYEEKTGIMQNMFGIPSKQIVQTSPYRPDVSLTGKDPANTAIVLVFSAKDAGRLKGGNYLRDYEPGAEMVPSDQAGYILEVPIQEGGMSATDFRNAMKNDSLNDNQKMMKFREFFGSINQQVYEFIKGKLNGSAS